MNNITVTLVIEPSVSPKAIVGGLASLTQFRKEFSLAGEERGERIINAITTMGHTSLLEPLRFAVVIHGASRVFLAQITRHRQCTFVSQSQQYQDQTGFPFVTIPELHSNPEMLEKYRAFMVLADSLYCELAEAGIPKDQARYVIPGAACNDLYIDANAREWIEVIFPQRLCRRNTLETRYIMADTLNLFFQKGYDYLFKHTGPACITIGKCDQGKMACGRPFKSFEELLNKETV